VTPTTDQLTVVVTGNSCDIEARYGGRTQRAHYESARPGSTGPALEVVLTDPAAVGSSNASQVADPVLQEVTSSLFEALRAGAPDLYAETVAGFLMAHVLLRYPGFVPPKTESPACHRLRRVDEFMHDHLDEPLSLEDIAREVGLSRFHTLRLFKSAFGETPVRRLTRLRMERAKTCLTTSDEPVTEIAFRCGYENPAHFASAFRRWTGASPTEYRASGVVQNAPQILRNAP
jgi:AraC family transcriptional regulator